MPNFWRTSKLKQLSLLNDFASVQAFYVSQSLYVRQKIYVRQRFFSMYVEFINVRHFFVYVEAFQFEKNWRTQSAFLYFSL